MPKSWLGPGLHVLRTMATRRAAEWQRMGPFNELSSRECHSLSANSDGLWLNCQICLACAYVVRCETGEEYIMWNWVLLGIHDPGADPLNQWNTQNN